MPPVRSQTLSGALRAFVGKHYTFMANGYIQAVTQDGTLWVKVDNLPGTVPMRSTYDQNYSIGERVLVSKKRSGQLEVIGKAGMKAVAVRVATVADVPTTPSPTAPAPPVPGVTPVPVLTTPPPPVAQTPAATQTVITAPTLSFSMLSTDAVTATVTVSVSGGAQPNGTVSLALPGTTSLSAPLVAGVATFSLTGTAEGAHQLGAAFVPTDPTTQAPSSVQSAVVVTVTEPYVMVGNPLGGPNLSRVWAYTSPDGLHWHRKKELIGAATGFGDVTPALYAPGSAPPNGPSSYAAYNARIHTSTEMFLGGWATAADPNDFLTAAAAGADLTTLYGADKFWRSAYVSGSWQPLVLMFKKLGYTVNDMSLITIGGRLYAYHTALPTTSAYPMIIFKDHAAAVMISDDDGATWGEWQIVIPATASGDGQGAWVPSALYMADGTLWLYYHTGTSDFSQSITWRQQMSADGLSRVGAPQRCLFDDGGWMVNVFMTTRTQSDQAYDMYWGRDVVGAETIHSMSVTI